MSLLRVWGALVLCSGSLILATPSLAQEFNCSCNTNSHCDERGDCRCEPGWQGEACDACVPTPGCVHGSCHQPWQCTCQPGWTGRFCDKDILVCSRLQPCQNGATCVLGDSGEHACLCPHGFHGNNCQFKTGPCHRTRAPCRNGGVCEDDGGFSQELRCRCTAGFNGPRCETDRDDCHPSPCANGATCLDGPNRFSCRCPNGFSGRFCTVRRDRCSSRPCLHGGRCLDRPGAALCLCPSGYTGLVCQLSQGGGGAPVSAAVATPGPQLKVWVQEVQAGGGMSWAQGGLLLALGGVTLALLLLTTGLLLRGGRACRGGASPRRRGGGDCGVRAGSQPEKNWTDGQVI